MGFTVERTGYVDMAKLTNDLLLDLTGNGFTVIHPAQGITTDTVEATVEATNTVDPLIGGSVPAEEQQPWRIKFKWDPDYKCFYVWVACPQQLDDQGGKARYNKYWDSGALAWTLTADPATYPPKIPDSLATDDPDLIGEGINPNESTIPPVFFNRYYDNINTIPNMTDLDFTKSWWQENAHPIAYRLSISDHGIAFMMWDESLFNGARYFNWFVVQRPVNSATGAVLTTGKAPLFCVYSVGGADDRTFRFTVRETDIDCPDFPRNAVVHSDDAHAIINNVNQVSITESDNYVLTFPNGINTRRYMYTEELDMIAFTSADVISQWADVEIPVYGEATPRTYRGMHSNGENNTGMRVLMLVDGGGV